MKKYKAEKMVRISRYNAYFQTLLGNLWHQIYNRINELILGEKEYCDRGNFKHLSQILTSIALYEVLQKNGYSEEEAFRIVSEEMWKALNPEPMKRFARKKIFFHLMKIIVPVGFKLGSGTGWRYTWYKDKSKDRFRFECNECIYEKIFDKRNLRKIGVAFCHSDVITYGELPYIDFRRRGTLCRGDEKCDFEFIRHKTETGWERSKSV